METNDKHSSRNNASEKMVRTSTADQANSPVWRFALIEMLHVLGVYFTHTRNEQAQRAADALFEQIIRTLSMLEKIPGHNGAVTIHRVDTNGQRTVQKTDYLLSLGSMGFQARAWLMQDDGREKISSARYSALEHSFACLEKLGVNGLSIRFPGSSPERVEQLRLAFEIVGHYREAAENRSNLKFAFRGRPRSVALVRDGAGRPDPNLTLMAGANALSALNAGELVKQADALLALSNTANGSADRLMPSDTYERIFSIAGLHNGLLRPLVEVVTDDVPGSAVSRMTSTPVSLQTETPAACDWRIGAAAAGGIAAAEPVEYVPAFEQTFHFLYSCLEEQDKEGRSALDRLYRTDCAKISPGELFHWLDSAIKARQLAEGDTRSQPLIQRLDAFIQERLERIPKALWAKVGVRRTTISLDTRGRTLLLGMAPAAVTDIVALVRERVMCPRKLAFVASCIDPYHPLDLQTTASMFTLSKEEAEQVGRISAACFHDPTGLEHRNWVDATVWSDACQNALVQIMWCHLRGNGRPQSHLTMLGGLQMQLARLKDPIPMLNFLLTDMAQSTSQLSAADYDALALCTLLLRGADGHVEIGFTDEGALDESGRIDAVLRKYAVWRLERERPRMVAKFGQLTRALKEGWRAVCNDRAATVAGFQFLLDLEREMLIFLGLVGGALAAALIRETVKRVAYHLAFLSIEAMPLHWRSSWFGQIRLTVCAMGCVGLAQDAQLLDTLPKNAERWSAGDVSTTHDMPIGQIPQWVSAARRAIQARSV